MIIYIHDGDEHFYANHHNMGSYSLLLGHEAFNNNQKKKKKKATGVQYITKKCVWLA